MTAIPNIKTPQTIKKSKQRSRKGSKQMLIPAVIIKPRVEVSFKNKKKRLDSTRVLKPKGVLAVVKSCVLNSKGEVPIKLVDAKSAAKTIASGSNFGGDVIVIHDNNKVTPGYLPDLSDLALFPAGLKIALKWIVENQGGEGGVGSEKVIPKSISRLLGGDAKPNLQTTNVTVGNHSIKFNSYSDYKHLFFTSNDFTIQQLTISSNLHTSNILDGKKIVINMTVGKTNVVVSESIIGRTKWLVWNCKSLAKDTFLEDLKATIEFTMADVVILTETRVSVHMGRVISDGLHPYAVYGSSKTVADGGHAIVVFRKENMLELIDSFSNSKTYCFMQ